MQPVAHIKKIFGNKSALSGVKVHMAHKKYFFLTKEYYKLGGSPLTVFRYLIQFQSYDHLKKFYTVVTSSLGIKMGWMVKWATAQQ